jgi:hypothetical protein
MKVRTYTFSGILILVLGLLHVQPLFFHQATKEQVCTKSKCSKQNPSQKSRGTSNEQKNCPYEGCNPFVPCSAGNCCYLVETFFSHSAISVIKKQKFPVINDNTLLSAVFECWHPPEITF